MHYLDRWTCLRSVGVVFCHELSKSTRTKPKLMFGDDDERDLHFIWRLVSPSKGGWFEACSRRTKQRLSCKSCDRKLSEFQKWWQGNLAEATWYLMVPSHLHLVAANESKLFRSFSQSPPINAFGLITQHGIPKDWDIYRPTYSRNSIKARVDTNDTVFSNLGRERPGGGGGKNYAMKRIAHARNCLSSTAWKNLLRVEVDKVAIVGTQSAVGMT